VLAFLGLGMPSTPRQALHEMIAPARPLVSRLKFETGRLRRSRRRCSSEWTPRRPSRWG
jgi:hypothetical protein